MLRMRIGLVVAPAILLSGCAAFSEYDVKDDVVPIVFRRLQCEILAAKNKDIVPNSILSDNNWEVLGQLEVNVNTHGSLGSSPKMTNTFSSGSVSWAASPSISAEKDQTFKYYFRTETSKIKPKDCKSGVQNEFSLRGDLGVVGAVRLATEATALKDDFPSRALEGGALFSHQVDFTVTKSVDDTGPTWVISRFSGLGLSMGAHRTDKHNLLVAFRLLPEPSAGPRRAKMQRTISPSVVVPTYRASPSGIQLLFDLDKYRQR